ncbi:MAG: DUF29 domain-containing protein [Chroococcidiopsidaceae cyanobacterium CP_BM_RX_35]|nr:DUF29 domain-containing protein [Chroococcidiopsidaceae cyanobacterium CP_BM_RX_35]
MNVKEISADKVMDYVRQEQAKGREMKDIVKELVENRDDVILLSRDPEIVEQQLREIVERDKKESALIKNELSELYETDFVLWSEKTAQLLRERSFKNVDWDNVIEEIEGLGSSDKRGLRSQLIRIIKHLLKWQYQHEKRSRSWEISIRNGRMEAKLIVEDSPSLKPYQEQVLQHCYESAVAEACEETNLDPDAFPETCPYSLAQVLQEPIKNRTNMMSFLE